MLVLVFRIRNILVRIRVQILFFSSVTFKVVTKGNKGESGRWQMIDIGFEPW
jgi:hypothetical protein